MQKTILLGTRKGLIAYHFKRNKWAAENLSFEGAPVSIAYADPRTRTWWACIDYGHWGVKLHRSTDRGKNWEEITGAGRLRPGRGEGSAPAVHHGGDDPDGVRLSLCRDL